jgi:hypothetical protein
MTERKLLNIKIDDLSNSEQAHVLSLAGQIKTKQLLAKQFESFKASKSIMIRWDASQRDFGFSYCGVNVTPEEVEHLVKEKLKQ